MFFGPEFLGEDHQILDLVFKIALISDHVAKFHSDRPRDRGDLALKKKKNGARPYRNNSCIVLDTCLLRGGSAVNKRDCKA